MKCNKGLKKATPILSMTCLAHMKTMSGSMIAPARLLGIPAVQGGTLPVPAKSWPGMMPAPHSLIASSGNASSQSSAKEFLIGGGDGAEAGTGLISDAFGPAHTHSLMSAKLIAGALYHGSLKKPA